VATYATPPWLSSAKPAAPTRPAQTPTVLLFSPPLPSLLRPRARAQAVAPSRWRLPGCFQGRSTRGKGRSWMLR
jgi:hypothetical protein